MIDLSSATIRKQTEALDELIKSLSIPSPLTHLLHMKQSISARSVSKATR